MGYGWRGGDMAREGLLTVATAQALRDYTTSDLPSVGPVMTLGAFGAGDGGGGSWRYAGGAAPGTHVDNGGTVLVPAGGNGSAAWLRQYKGAVELAWFVGGSAGDVTSLVQNAVNAAAGGRLVCGHCAAEISGPTGGACITLPAAGIAITGDGPGRSVFYPSALATAFAATDAGWISIDGISIDGQQSLRTGWQRGIVLYGVVSAQISNCTLQNLGGSAIVVAKYGGDDGGGLTAGTRQSQNVALLHNHIIGCHGAAGILTKHVGVHRLLISGNVIRDGCSTGISCESESSAASEISDKVIIANNIVHNTGYRFTDNGDGTFGSSQSWGIAIAERSRQVVCTGNVVSVITGEFICAGITISTAQAQDDLPVTDVVCAGNTISNIGAASGRGIGIYIACGDVDVEGLAVNANVISGVTYGIEFGQAVQASTAGLIRHSAIVGNVIQEAATTGIFFSTLNDSGDAPLRHSVIADNVIINPGTNGMGLVASNCQITGNYVSGAGNHGILLNAGGSGCNIAANTAVECGVSGIVANGDDTTLQGNHCQNNGQTGVGYGIYLNSGLRGLIFGNRCGDAQGSPTQDYGIRAPNGSTVRNNEVMGNVSAGIWGNISNHNTGTYDAGLNRTA